MGLISIKLYGFLLEFSTNFTSISVLLLFSLLITFFVFMYSFWLNFIYHRWGSLDFSISNDPTQMLNFPTWIPDFPPFLLFRISFFLLRLVFTLQGPCSIWKFWSFVVSVYIDFSSNSKWDAPFHCISYDCSCADQDCLCDHLRDVPWEDIFKLNAPATAADGEFCEQVQVGIDIYISHRKYQVKPHSCPWFSDACATAIVHRNHFLRFYQHNKSSERKFRQVGNCCKKIIEAAKPAYTNKTK